MSQKAFNMLVKNQGPPSDDHTQSQIRSHTYLWLIMFMHKTEPVKMWLSGSKPHLRAISSLCDSTRQPDVS